AAAATIRVAGRAAVRRGGVAVAATTAAACDDQAAREIALRGADVRGAAAGRAARVARGVAAAVEAAGRAAARAAVAADVHVQRLAGRDRQAGAHLAAVAAGAVATAT